MFRNNHNQYWKRIVCAVMTIVFSFSTFAPSLNAYAQTLPLNPLNLPPVGTMVPMSPAFAPAVVKGVTVHADNPLKFNFIVDTGDSQLSDQALQEEATRLIKYFLATITIPENDLWVNLNPEENDRIVPNSFGVTEMGRDLLAQDYMLKQLTASLMYPEKELGQKFWKRVRQLAQEKYGTDDIPMNSVNKVWIVPQKAVVYEYQNSAYVVDSHLKVMMEQEYLAASGKSIEGSEELDTNPQTLTSDVIKNVIIPEIEKEVNQGENFAKIRQVYNSMILASWYKDALKESLLAKVYADQNLIKGVDVNDKQIKQKIYDQYMEAFKEGVYNYIREDYNDKTGELILRKYVSGGAAMKIKPIREDIKGAPEQLNDEDFAVVVKGLAGISEKSRLLNLGVTVVENLDDEQSAQLIASLQNAQTVKTKLVEQTEGQTEKKDDLAMVTARHQIADIIMFNMKNTQSIIKKISSTEANEIRLTNEILQQIDEDISIPLWMSGSVGTEITAVLIPQMAEKMKEAARQELKELMPLYAQLKKHVLAMESTQNADDYESEYEQADQLFTKIQKKLQKIRFKESKKFTTTTAKDKATKTLQVVKNTIKHQFSQKFMISFIQPKWLPIDAPEAKKKERFTAVKRGIEEIERIAQALQTVTKVPKEEKLKNFFNLEDLFNSQSLEPQVKNAEQIQQVSQFLISRIKDSDDSMLIVTEKDLENLPMSDQVVRQINEDISIPIIIKATEDDNYMIFMIDDMLPQLKRLASKTAFNFSPLISRMLIAVENMKNANDKQSYAKAYAEIPPLVYKAEYQLKMLTYKYPEITVPTLKKRKSQTAQQILKNTLAYYILDRMNLYFLAPENLPFFAPPEEKLSYFSSVEKNLNEIQGFIEKLLNIKRVPRQLPNDVIFDIEDVTQSTVSEDFSMAVAQHQELAGNLMRELENAGQNKKTYTSDQIFAIGLTPIIIQQINQDVTIPLYIEAHSNQTFTVSKLDDLTTVAQAEAKEQIAKLRNPLERLKLITDDLRITSSRGAYSSIYEHFDPAYGKVLALLKELPTDFTATVPISSRLEKTKRLRDIINNTLKHYISNKLVISNISPDSVFDNRSLLRRNVSYAVIMSRFLVIQSLLDAMEKLDKLPELLNGAPIFDLESVVRSTGQSLTKNIATGILRTMKTQNADSLIISKKEADIILIDEKQVQKINQNVSIPLWIEMNEEGNLVATYLPDMPELLKETAAEKLVMLLGYFSKLKQHFNQLKLADNAHDYEMAYAGIDSGIKGISEELMSAKLYVQPNDIVEIQTPQTKLLRAKQMISNTIRHFVSNKTYPIVILDPFLTPFEDTEKRIENIQTAERSIKSVDAIFNILLDLSEVPAQQDDDGVYAIEPMIKKRVPEDYAMSSKEVASQLLKIAEQGETRYSLSSQKAQALGLTNTSIEEINQDLSVPVWISGSIEEGVTVETFTEVARNFSDIARKNINGISVHYFEIYRELKTMFETKSEKQYENSFEKIQTLVKAIDFRLEALQTSLKDKPAPSNEREKIDQIYTLFVNSISYYTRNRMNPDLINPTTVPFNTPKEEKQEAFTQFHNGVASLGVLFHKILNVTAIPERLGNLEIYDLHQILGINPRTVDDFSMAVKSIEESYAQGIHDEFVKPTVIQTADGNPKGRIKNGDSLVFFNFRADRAREILRAFRQPEFNQFEREKALGLTLRTMTDYEIYDTVAQDEVAFLYLPLQKTLGEIVSQAGFSQLRIAETEKYNHVTYFFNGKTDETFEGETRILIPSPKEVATYDLKPEMSAIEVTDQLINAVNQKPYNLIVLNYANMDMVGHTGVIDAARKAAETVDQQLTRVLPMLIEKGYNIIITADHGNGEKMWDAEDKQPFTAHTTNPVPFIFMPGKGVIKSGDMTIRGNGRLADVAPTILKTLNLPQPEEMTGTSIISGFDFENAPQQKTALFILDGWGINPDKEDPNDAIRTADTPYMDRLMETTLNTTINAHGLDVGILDGVMGNSEVGHANLGGGRVDKQPIVDINEQIDNGEFFKNPKLVQLMEETKAAGKPLHLMGLVSDGLVHSSMKHLFALIEMAKRYEIDDVYIHAILDGRDTPPESGKEWLQQLQDKLNEIGKGEIVDVIGRFYAMDRDQRWERVKIAYDLYTEGKTQMPDEDTAMSTYELTELALAQKVFNFDFAPFEGQTDKRLDGIKMDIQYAQAQTDLIEFYKAFVHLRLYLEKYHPQSPFMNMVTFKIRHILDFAEENQILLPQKITFIENDDEAMATQPQEEENNLLSQSLVSEIANVLEIDPEDVETALSLGINDLPYEIYTSSGILIDLEEVLATPVDQLDSEILMSAFSQLSGSRLSEEEVVRILEQNTIFPQLTHQWREEEARIQKQISLGDTDSWGVPSDQISIPIPETTGANIGWTLIGDDLAMISHALREKALREGILDFTYPVISGAEKKIVKEIKTKVLESQRQNDLIEFYKRIVALRKAVGSSVYRGRPYHYLTSKIKIIETFAQENGITLPEKKDVNVDDYAMTSLIQEASQLLGINKNIIELALMLGYNQLPHDFYQYYGLIQNSKVIADMKTDLIDADIFIAAIAGESEGALTEEEIVNTFEEAGIFAILTDKWRAAEEELQTADKDSWGVPFKQVSVPIEWLPEGGFVILSDDTAMTVTKQSKRIAEIFSVDQHTVELALTLASYGLPFEVTQEIGIANLESFDLNSVKRINPYLFIDNLIEAAKLNQSFNAVVAAIEQENLFPALTEKILEDEKVTQFMITFDIPIAADTLGMRTEDVELALKLGSVGLSYSNYTDHGITLEDTGLENMRIVLADPSIFIDALIQEGDLDANEERVVEILEEKGAFTPLTQSWRTEQAIIKNNLSEGKTDSWGVPLQEDEDLAMSVQDNVRTIADQLEVEEETVELALVLAYRGIDYGTYQQYDIVLTETVEDIDDFEDLSPEIFLETLIHEGELDLNEEDIISMMEDIGMFYELTETFRDHQQEIEDAIASGLVDSWGVPILEKDSIDLEEPDEEEKSPLLKYSGMWTFSNVQYNIYPELLILAESQKTTPVKLVRALLEGIEAGTIDPEAYGNQQDPTLKILKMYLSGDGDWEAEDIKTILNITESVARYLSEKSHETDDLAMAASPARLAFSIERSIARIDELQGLLKGIQTMEKPDQPVTMEIEKGTRLSQMPQEWIPLIENQIGLEGIKLTALKTAQLRQERDEPTYADEDVDLIFQTMEQGLFAFTEEGLIPLNMDYNLGLMKYAFYANPLDAFMELKSLGHLSANSKTNIFINGEKTRFHFSELWSILSINTPINLHVLSYEDGTTNVVLNFYSNITEEDLIDDVAMATDARMVSFEIEQTLKRIMELKATRNHVTSQKPKEGLIQLNVGQMLWKTPEGWREFFNQQIKELESRLLILFKKEKQMEKESPTQADAERKELYRLFDQQYFSTKMEEAFSDNQKSYQFINGDMNILYRLSELKKKIYQAKINLLMQGEKQKITFFDAENYLYQYKSLHIIEYKDGSINAVLVMKPKAEDLAMGTGMPSSFTLVQDIQNVLRDKPINADNGQEYILIPRVDSQTEQGAYYIDVDIKGEVKTKPTRAMRLVMKDGDVIEFNIDLTQLKFTDSGETTDLSTTDISTQIMLRLMDIFSRNEIEQMVFNMDTGGQALETGGWFFSRYDPFEAKTVHYYEGALDDVEPIVVSGDERKLGHDEVMKRHGKEKWIKDDFAMSMPASLINMKLEQSFERLNELSIERISMTMASLRGETDVIMRNFGQVLFNTPEGWEKYYGDIIKQERANYHRLVDQKEEQELQSPTEADKDIELIKTALDKHVFADAPVEGVLVSSVIYKFIQGDTEVFDQLRDLRKSLARKKVNLFTPGLIRTAFQDVFDRMKHEKNLILHVLTYKDGSINVIYSPRPSEQEDDAMATQPQMDQIFLSQQKTGKAFIQELKGQEITLERLQPLMEMPIFIDNSEASEFLPKGWQSLFARFANNLSEGMRYDFSKDWIEMERKWINGDKVASPKGKAVFVIFDSNVPVLQKGAEVIFTKDMFFRMIASLASNGRKKEAVRFVHFMETKLQSNGNSADEDLAMSANATIEKPKVIIAMDSVDLTNEVYQELNKAGGINVIAASYVNETHQLLRNGITPSIVLTDNQNLITRLEKEHPKVSVFAYKKSADQKIKGTNILADFSQQEIPTSEMGTTILQTLWRINHTDDGYGGIDFTRGMLNLEIKRDGKGIPLPVSDQPLEQMKIEGFFPVIINVTPINNLPLLLGMKKTDEKIAKK